MPLTPGELKMSTATQNEYENVKSPLIDSLQTPVTFISPCPSSRSISAQNQPLVRAFLWGLKHHKEEPTPEWALLHGMKGGFVIINYSATKLSVGRLAIWGFLFCRAAEYCSLVAHLQTSGETTDSPDKHTNLDSRSCQFMASNRFKDLSCGLGKEFPEACKGSIHFHSLNVVISVGQVSAPC